MNACRRLSVGFAEAIADDTDCAASKQLWSNEMEFL